jgi:PPP family 3-phenylpropionic acid transporter
MTLSYRSDPVPSKWSAAFFAAYFAVLGVVLPFLGPYLQLRGISALGIGLVTASFSLAKLVYSPLLGAAVDRGLWFRGMLTVHIAVSICFVLVLNFVRSQTSVLMAAFFLIGLGYGTVLPLVEATILERVPRRGYGLLRMWGSIGFVVAAAVAAVAVSGDLVAAFPLLVAATLAALWLSCLPFERVARPRRPSTRGRLPGTVWGLLALLTLHQVAHGPYYAFFSIHLKSIGYSSLSVSVMWSLGVVAELLAFLCGPMIERYLGLRRLLGLALLASPVRWLLLALPPSVPLLIVAQLGHAVTFALVHLAGVQLVQANASAGTVRNAQALYSGLSFGLGIVVGTAVAGPLYAGLGGAGSFLVAAVFSAVLFLSWIPLSDRVREVDSVRQVDGKRETSSSDWTAG